MLKTVVPVFQVSTSSSAEDFYCRKLGFRLVSSYRPDPAKADPCYLTLTRDGIHLHVQSFKSGITGSGNAYVHVDNVEALYSEFTSKGVAVNGPFDQTWGQREIGVRDPDGNNIGFGQRLAGQ